MSSSDTCSATLDLGKWTDCEREILYQNKIILCPNLCDPESLKELSRDVQEFRNQGHQTSSETPGTGFGLIELQGSEPRDWPLRRNACYPEVECNQSIKQQ